MELDIDVGGDDNGSDLFAGGTPAAAASADPLSDEAVEARFNAFMAGKKKGASDPTEEEDSEESPEGDSEEGGEDAEGEGLGEVGAEEPDEPEVKLGGSREKPIKHNDLPDDQFVEISIDGQKEVLSVKDLARGHMRQRAFTKRLEETKEATRRATEAVRKAEEYKVSTRNQINALFGDPDRLRGFMLDHFPEVLEKVSEADVIERLRVEQMDPRQQSEYWLKRNSRKAEAERRRVMESAKRREQEIASQQAYESTRQMFIRAQSKVYGEMRFDPTEITDTMRQDIKDMVGGRKLTPELAENVIRRAIRMHRAENPPEPKKPLPKKKRRVPKADPVVESKNPRKKTGVPKSLKDFRYGDW